MKMKMSILLGVLHMNLGILMSLFNNTYFRDSLSTWAEFVPQVCVWGLCDCDCEPRGCILWGCVTAVMRLLANPGSTGAALRGANVYVVCFVCGCVTVARSRIPRCKFVQRWPGGMHLCNSSMQ